MLEVKKKIVFIINPISGLRSKKNLPNLIYQNIDSKTYDVEVFYTEYAHHATEIAKRSVDESAFCVVAAGGDGTVNEVAKALLHSSTRLGIIPLGSGNGLARHLNIPLDIKKAIELINSNQLITIDCGKLNGQIFFCTAGIGFDALISKRFANSKMRGPASYLGNILKEYPRYTPKDYTLICDDSIYKEKAFMITIGNAGQFGNNAFITPNANIQDGLLDITIVKPFKLQETPLLLYQLFDKHLDSNPRVKSLVNKKIRIILPEPEIMHIDGDPIKVKDKADIEIVEKALQVIAILRI